MPIMSENPCAEHHQELALMTNCTSLRDVHTMMLCNRCGETMTFEAAVRNDERMKIAQAIDDWAMDVYQSHPDRELLENAQYCANLARRHGRESSDG